MQDRIPLYPGRVKLTPVSGQENIYDMVRADQATQEGTPLNKANLLSDEVAAAIAALAGVDAPGTPNEALDFLTGVASALKSDAVKIETGSYTGTGTRGSSNPNSITFSFVPKLVILLYYYRNGTYDIEDQLNMTNLQAMVASGAEAVPYHADGEECRYYSAADFSAIAEAATAWKLYQESYFNSLRNYIRSLTTAEEIAAVTYGMEIPAAYQSDVLKDLIGGTA